jgi:hypothetical protein
MQNQSMYIDCLIFEFTKIESIWGGHMKWIFY